MAKDTNMNGSAVSGEGDPYPFDDFAPTLAQCFFIVIAGYLAARFQLLTTSDQRGVNAFATYFAMPGIICVSLADADFGDFSWELLSGLMLGKLFLFTLVWGGCCLLGHSAGIAAIVALFCVQSNDLPVGNPLMSALYRDYRPHMMKYLFLMPASTLLFFVPVANAAIEMDKYQRREKKRASVNGCGKKSSCSYRLLTRKNWLLIYSSVKSPVVLSTVLGVALNALFKPRVPGILHQPINVVAATIPGIALSILGFSFVRKERYLLSSAVVPATLLLIIKMVLTPLVLHTTVRLLTSGTRLLSDFALLYGIISPATAVFQAGQEFRKPLAAMSVALIVTSFTCFPASYVVARFTIAPTQNMSYYIPMLQTVLFWIAAGSAACDVMVWISILWKRKWCAVPFNYVICLVFTQFITSCGVLFWNLSGNQSWSLYFQMALYFGGEVAGYVWLATVAVVLVLEERRPASLTSGYSIFFMAFSLSALIAAVMCALVFFRDISLVYFVGPTTCSFEFWQMAAATVLLLLCWGIAAVCLVLHFKKLPRTEGNVVPGKTDKRPQCYENEIFCIESPEEERKQNVVEVKSVFGQKEEVDFYYEEILRCGGNGRNSYEEKDWSFRIFSLILIVWLTMAVKLVSNLFKLMRSDAQEIMVPLEFLQSSLFVGQGFFLLLTCGVDVRTMAISLVKWCRKMRNGKEDYLPGRGATEEEVVATCRLFYQFYWRSCFRDIAKERRWKENVYKDCFWGHQLVDWLIREELCKEDIEAEEYGQKLLLGGVIGHVRDAHPFYDAPYLYHFIGRKFKSSAG